MSAPPEPTQGLAQARRGAGGRAGPTVPADADPTVRRATGAIGGPMGRYAAAAPRWFVPLRLLMVLTAITMLLAWAQKSPCADGQWVGDSQYSQLCYSDVIPLWGAEGLADGAVPYRDHAVEYPVLTGGFLWATGEITRGIGALADTPDLGVLFGVVTAIALALCAFACVGFTAGAARPRPWDAAILALSPLLVFHAFSNWDLIAMALTSAGLWAWARRRPVAAGVLFGLGIAAKLYPLFVLVAIAILAVRTRRYREAVWCGVAAALAWLAVNLPVAAAFYRGWREFYAFSADRPAEASSIWSIVHWLTTEGLGGGVGTAWTPPGVDVAFFLLVALVVVAVLGLSAPQRPRLAQLALLCVVAFLITTKVWSPQYSIWLIPLVALARPRWRITLIWQGSEILVWILTLLWLGGFDRPDRGLNYGWLVVSLLVRDAILLVLCALVVRDMWRPEHDVVRAPGPGQPDGLDDPGGGVFDGAEDFWSAERRRARRAERDAEVERSAPQHADVAPGDERQPGIGEPPER